MSANNQTTLRENFWMLPLAELTNAEWEALCDGCGRCCLHKFEDEDDGAIYFTDVACKLLDLEQGGCKHYNQRQNFVPDCQNIAQEDASIYNALPSTCAYKLRYLGEALPAWHPLLTGNKQAMQAAGISVIGKVTSEVGLSDRQIERRLIAWIN